MRKIALLASCFTFLSMGTLVLYAQDTATPSDTQVMGESTFNRAFIGVTSMRRHWDFSDESRVPQTLIGGMIGVEHLKPSAWFYRLQFSFQNGHARSGNWYDHEIDVQAHLGYSIAFRGDALTVTPYTGFGVFYDNEPTYNDLRLRESYPFIPLGLFAQYRVHDGLSVGLRSQLNIVCNRKIKADHFNYKTQNYITWYSELPITLALGRGFDISLAPFYFYGSDVEYRTDTFSSDWGSMKTVGARLELGYRF